MKSEVILIIVGMAAVTYLPRMIPLVVLSRLALPPFVQNVLKNVPFAILGALILPGVLQTKGGIWFGIIGSLVAFFAAYLGANVVIVVFSAIVSLVIYGMIV
ncbi:AzlD domain-containing protein [Metabacillus sp. GX 13764]|uniref:AzlD domain-containing protein n=1 Tax=Metabacillus kandeliae TaxID=2900151 RepID=UPI001E309946|nr:AzlD domain-containing protein [Metabacillus kandeliae]MCD7034880.1 AzlD domain-containing protein [Metabacillus kandeliae]